jgi:hypothetical protein
MHTKSKKTQVAGRVDETQRTHQLAFRMRPAYPPDISTLSHSPDPAATFSIRASPIAIVQVKVWILAWLIALEPTHRSTEKR